MLDLGFDPERRPQRERGVDAHSRHVLRGFRIDAVHTVVRDEVVAAIAGVRQRPGKGGVHPMNRRDREDGDRATGVPGGQIVPAAAGNPDRGGERRARVARVRALDVVLAHEPHPGHRIQIESAQHRQIPEVPSVEVDDHRLRQPGGPQLGDRREEIGRFAPRELGAGERGRVRPLLCGGGGGTPRGGEAQDDEDW